MGQEKEKILMLITNSGTGGAERVFYEHSINLAELYDVTECYFSLDRGGSPNAGKIPVVTLENIPAKNWKERFTNLLKRVTKVRDLKKESNYAVCISHMDGANWVNVLSRTKNKTRTITCIHGSLFKEKNRGKHLYKFLLNRVWLPMVYPKANAIVCVSDHIKSELEILIGRRKNIYSIPNFFDLGKIDCLSKEEPPAALSAILKTKQVLLGVGRLAREKNYLSLIKLFAAVHKQFPGTRLFLIGDGPQRDLIINEIKQNDLSFIQYESQDSLPDVAVYLLGLQKNPFPYMKAAKAFLMTSYNEGFPLVLGESLACELPVVSYDCTSGPRQILAPELAPDKSLDEIYRTPYGLLLPMQKKDEISVEEMGRWVKAIGEILNHQGIQQIKKAARQRASDFSKETVLKQWIDLIDAEIREFRKANK